jgi:hypothetical protein
MPTTPIFLFRMMQYIIMMEQPTGLVIVCLIKPGSSVKLH